MPPALLGGASADLRAGVPRPHERVGALVHPVETALDGAAGGLERRVVRVAGDEDRLAQHHGAAAERQAEARPVPALEVDAPARHHGDRNDRPAREARERDDAAAADPRDLRHVGRHHHHLAVLERAQHGAQRGDAALVARIAAARARAADRAHAEMAQRDGVELAVAERETRLAARSPAAWRNGS